jgi:hypothetical protein
VDENNSESNPVILKEYTPFPWSIKRCGAHTSDKIIGSKVIQTNCSPPNSGPIRNALYSNTVCEFFSDLDLPGPAANARLITAIPVLIEALKSIVAHQEIVGGELASLSVTRQIAKDALNNAGVC